MLRNLIVHSHLHAVAKTAENSNLIVNFYNKKSDLSIIVQS